MNSNDLTNVLLFVSGVAIGSLTAWYITKKKYEPDNYWIDDNTDETDVIVLDDHSNKKTEDKPQKDSQYKQYTKDYKTEKNVSNEKNEKKEGYELSDEPYLVSINDFGELDDYTTTSLYYYEDHVITDELGNPIEEDDVAELIGYDNLKCMDEDPELDSCYIRNDVTKTDYEILRDMGCYYPVTTGGDN